MTEAEREAFQSYQKLYRQAVEERRSARLEDRPADYAGALHIEGRMDETRLRSLAACLNREAGSLYADILE